MDSGMHRYLQQMRAAELQAEAARWRLARQAAAARPHRGALRRRLGWVMVEVGLRLVA